MNGSILTSIFITKVFFLSLPFRFSATTALAEFSNWSDALRRECIDETFLRFLRRYLWCWYNYHGEGETQKQQSLFLHFLSNSAHFEGLWSVLISLWSAPCCGWPYKRTAINWEAVFFWISIRWHFPFLIYLSPPFTPSDLHISISFSVLLMIPRYALGGNAVVWLMWILLVGI